jgi:hypothetical protein
MRKRSSYAKIKYRILYCNDQLALLFSPHPNLLAIPGEKTRWARSLRNKNIYIYICLVSMRRDEFIEEKTAKREVKGGTCHQVAKPPLPPAFIKSLSYMPRTIRSFNF